MRLAINGPMPMPSRCSSVAGVAMLFHSPMSRMKKTLPDAVDGESEPKTISWRAHHGAMTTMNATTHATAAQSGMAGTRAPAERHARQRSHATASPRATRTSRPSFRDSVARPVSRPARTNDRGEPRSPRAPIQSAPATSGW